MSAAPSVSPSASAASAALSRSCASLPMRSLVSRSRNATTWLSGSAPIKPSAGWPLTKAITAGIDWMPLGPLDDVFDEGLRGGFLDHRVRGCGLSLLQHVPGCAFLSPPDGDGPVPPRLNGKNAGECNREAGTPAMRRAPTPARCAAGGRWLRGM